MLSEINKRIPLWLLVLGSFWLHPGFGLIVLAAVLADYQIKQEEHERVSENDR